MSTADGYSVGSQLQRSLDLLHQLYLDVEAAGSELDSVPRVKQTVQALKLQPNLKTLPSTLLQVYSELSQTLDSIRETRAAIQSCSLEQLRDTHARLSEVSTTTESAAMELLNGLDRTLAMIDQLEADSAQQQPSIVREALRNEVNQLYTHLQFQDIITQQLRGVGALLVDLEHRVASIADLFDGTRSASSDHAATPTPDPASFNPEASMRDARERQAAIDEAFRTAGDRAAGPRRAVAG